MLGKKLSIFTLAALTVITTTAWSQPAPTVVPGEVLVKFVAGREFAGHMLTTSLGGRVTQVIPQLKVQRIKLPTGMTVPQGVAYYDMNSAVDYVHPNYIMQKRFTPNDTLFGQQYGATQLRMPAAWDIGLGSPSVIIAIIDSGTDMTHPDLAGNVVPGKDYVDGDSDPTPTDGDAHGTHVSGIAGAVPNNSLGVAGMGYNCKIMGIRFSLNLAEGADAMVWAADNGAKVINMSWGYYGPPLQVLSDAVDYAHNKGALLVSAAGNFNYGGTDSYPDGFEKVLCVGGTGPNGLKVGFSDWGPRVDVAAPAAQILSTVPGGGYARFDGTSMSSPAVAGVAGLLFAHGGAGVSNVEVRAAIEDSTVYIGNWLQKGRVDAAAAMALIRPLVDVITTPTTITTNEGEYVSGDASSVTAADDSYYTINSVTVPRTGSVASAIVEFDVNFDVLKLRSSRMVVEARGGRLATNFLYFWNGSKWVSYRQFPLRLTDSSLTVNMGATLKNFIKDGKIRVMTRGNIAPRRGASPFQFLVDTVRFENRVQS